MRDYMELGPTPCDEPCAQVGAYDFESKVRKECRAYKHQLERLFPECDFIVKAFSHDFGTYYEVCVVYDTDDRQSAENALKVEINLPEKWDEEAKKELECLI